VGRRECEEAEVITTQIARKSTREKVLGSDTEDRDAPHHKQRVSSWKKGYKIINERGKKHR